MDEVKTKFPLHKKHRLNDEVYERCFYYHFIVCTVDHQKKVIKDPLSHIKLNIENEPFAELTELGKVCEKHFRNIEKVYPYVQIEALCIMPNHIHILFGINDEIQRKRTDALQIIKSTKGMITKEIGRSIWQKSSYDCITWKADVFRQMRDYVEGNPGKWYCGKHDNEIEYMTKLNAKGSTGSARASLVPNPGSAQSSLVPNPGSAQSPIVPDPGSEQAVLVPMVGNDQGSFTTADAQPMVVPRNDQGSFTTADAHPLAVPRNDQGSFTTADAHPLVVPRNDQGSFTTDGTIINCAKYTANGGNLK